MADGENVQSSGAEGRARLVSLLLLAAQATGGAHMLLVPHGRDPLTGQLVHPGHSHDGVRSSPRSPVGPSVEPFLPEDADEGDAGCLVALLHRLAFTSAASAGFAAAFPASSREPVRLDDRPGTGLPVHLVAPKQSPPV